MRFDEAVELATLIRTRPLWHVLEVAPVSGDPLDGDVWGVMAVCDLYHQYIHYWREPGSALAWRNNVAATEDGMRRRYTSHDVTDLSPHRP